MGVGWYPLTKTIQRPSAYTAKVKIQKTIKPFP